MQASADVSTMPFRIALVGPAPPPNGGMALQAAQLKFLLEAEGAHVEFLPTNRPYSPGWVASIPGLRALFRLIPYLLRVWIVAGRSDVFHLMANSGWSWHFFAMPVLLLAPLRSTPVIVNYRGGEAREFFQRSFRWVRPAMARASAVVVPSGFLEQVFQEFSIPTIVVPNIVDRTLFQSGADKSLDESPFVFVITRNLERIYGIDIAILALAELRQRGLSARLEIAGSGPQKASLQALARSLSVEDSVVFLGRLERADIVKLYARAGAMLNPTTVDNMPNSLIEALACGVPVISSNVGGVPFIVEDGKTALLVPVGDEHLLCDAMQKLMQDPKLRGSLAMAGEHSVSDFDWPSVRTKWLAVYQRVVPA